MKRTLHAVRLVLGLSIQVSPGRTVVVALLTAVQQFVGVLLALGLKWAVDAAYRGERAALVASVLLIALAQAVVVVGWSMLTVQRVMLNQRVGELIDRDVLRRIAWVPHTVHLEDPGHVERVERARRSGQQMANAVWAAVSAGLVLVQLLLTMVLLSSVRREFLALLPCLLLTLWCTERSRAILRRADRAAAEAERAERGLLDAGTDPAQAKELRLGDGMHLVLRRSAALWREAAGIRVRAEVRAALVQAGGWAVFLSGFLAALALVCHLVLTGRTTLGSVLLVITLMMSVRRSLAAVVGGVQGSAEGWENLRAYHWLRHRTAGADAPPVAPLAAVPDRLTGGISLREVGFRYRPDGPEVLQRVSLELPAGSTVALLGEHGSGKSTLVKLLCGLQEPTSGGIEVDGVPLAAFAPQDWRARTTAAFQDFCRFPFLAQETVGVGDLPRVDDPAAVSRAVRSAGATEVVSALPDGLRTLLGKELGDGAEISGGQWQKLAMARALLRTSPLLTVLDEPTAALDATAEHEVHRSFERLAKERGRAVGGITVLVSHRFSTVQMADLIVVLAHGRIVERGTHTELMAAGGTYAELYALQERAYHA